MILKVEENKYGHSYFEIMLKHGFIFQKYGELNGAFCHWTLIYLLTSIEN